jgi:hypothetical protein
LWLAAAGGVVALHEIGQLRAAVAGDADGDAAEGEADRLFGKEHECGSASFGCAHSDEERDGHLLGVLQSRGQADDCLAGHRCLLP